MATYTVDTDKGSYQVETEDPISKPESFGRGALNNFPLANQAVSAFDPSQSYSQSMSDLTTKAAAAKKANPVSYGAGAVAGSLAPLAIPGVGEALEAAPIAGNAALGAANAISNTDVLQNPGQAVKQGLGGAAIGAGTAGVLGKILPGEGAVNKLEDIARNQGVKSAGLRPGSLVNDQKFSSIGDYMKNNDLVQGSLESRLAKVQALKQAHGSEIGSVGAGASPLENFEPFTDPLMKKAAEYTKSYSPELKSQGQMYINGAKDIQQNGTNFAELQKIKSQYGDMAFNADHQVINPAAKDVYIAAKEAMESIINQSPKEYQAAMTGYAHASDIETGLSKQLGIERGVSQGHAGVGGHGLHSIIRQVPGVSNPSAAIPGGIALGAMGHPVLGGALALHSLLGSPQVRSATASGLAKAIPKGSQAITQEVNDYLTSKYGKKPE